MDITQTNEVSSAIKEFVKKSVVPLLYNDKDKDIVTQNGTGTLFKIKERFFIITAAHLYSTGYDRSEFAIPESRGKGALFTIGKHTLHIPNDKKIDIAILELQDDVTISRLMKQWCFLDESQIGLPKNGNTFFVYGFPEVLTETVDDLLAGTPVTIFTNLRDPPNLDWDADPFVDGLDLFFNYSREAISPDGQLIQTPILGGISGASFWKYVPLENKEAWAPQKDLQIVGIQSAYLHSSYMRAKSWTYVAGMFRTIDPSIGALLNAVLDHRRSQGVLR